MQQDRFVVRHAATSMDRGSGGAVLSGHWRVLASVPAEAARVHLSYIQRDGLTPRGDEGKNYGHESDEPNGIVFLNRSKTDRRKIAQEDAFYRS